MFIAMDVGELAESCRALGRVVEETSAKIGADSVDEDVLERLVSAVIKAPNDPDDPESEIAARNPNEGHGLSKRVIHLFETTILPRISSSPRIFRSYARLLTWQRRWDDVLKAYLDGYRCSSAGKAEKGEMDLESWREAVREVVDVVDVLRNFGPRVGGYNWKLQSRSIVRAFLGRTKEFEDEEEWGRLIELQNELRKEE